MVLEAFWKGDREELGYLCDADVHASFVQAIDAREAEGQKLENRLIRIEKMQIADASVNGSIASITLRFEADIAAVTRDREGNVIAGSMTDAVPTHDRSEEHTSELQSLMRISYAVFCLKKK